MTEFVVDLPDGLKLNGVPQRKATLKKLTAMDVIEASEASEKLVHAAEGPMLVVSPSRMGAEVLARQIDRIGDIPGPFSASVFGKLSPADMDALQAAAESLDEAVAKEVSRRGRDDPAGAGSD